MGRVVEGKDTNLPCTDPTVFRHGCTAGVLFSYWLSGSWVGAFQRPKARRGRAGVWSCHH